MNFGKAPLLESRLMRLLYSGTHVAMMNILKSGFTPPQFSVVLWKSYSHKKTFQEKPMMSQGFYPEIIIKPMLDC